MKLSDAELTKTIAAARDYVATRERGPVIVANPYDALDTATAALVWVADLLAEALDGWERCAAPVDREIFAARIAHLRKLARP